MYVALHRQDTSLNASAALRRPKPRLWLCRSYNDKGCQRAPPRPPPPAPDAFIIIKAKRGER